MATLAEYRVESSVPFPELRSNAKYPFATMKVGDSFTASETERGRISCAANIYAKRNGSKFVTRKIDTGTIRIWRTA